MFKKLHGVYLSENNGLNWIIRILICFKKQTIWIRREMYPSNSIFDIIVVGAGPAGASVTSHASRQGFSICLLEKSSLKNNGRYKACGKTID